MDDFVKLAVTAATHAGLYLKKNINKARIVRYKRGKVDIVTNADLASQKSIIEFISKEYPEHKILAEESEDCVDTSGYLWVIDPIDGTSAFASGLPTYSVSIALLYNRQPIVGAIYLSILQDVIFAIKDKGCFYQGKKQTVSDAVSLEEASIGFDPGYINRETYFQKIAAPLSDKVRIMPMIYSQASALGLISLGIFDGYIQCGSPKAWDVAAGKLLVKEAKGVLTDFKNREVDIFHQNGYLAGSPLIQQQLFDYIKRNF